MWYRARNSRGITRGIIVAVVAVVPAVVTVVAVANMAAAAVERGITREIHPGDIGRRASRIGSGS